MNTDNRKRQRGRRSTPAGQHWPVLLDEVLQVLAPTPGALVVDCTVGWAGHAAELLARIGASGRLIGLDFDAETLPRAKERLEPLGFPYSLCHANFAGLQKILAAEGVDGADLILADLGMSSMQVDDPERGFSYIRDGPLDMRMDRSRGRSAAQILAAISEPELAAVFRDLGDEPDADQLAAVIVAAREQAPLERTSQLAQAILEAMKPAGSRWRLHPSRGKWNTHPAARTFQALRILVNRDLANLEHLLRVLPSCLRAGGRAAIISFHSGEDRLVKAAFRQGLREGIYEKGSEKPVRPTFAERTANPRARSAKLRWVCRSGERPP